MCYQNKEAVRYCSVCGVWSVECAVCSVQCAVTIVRLTSGNEESHTQIITTCKHSTINIISKRHFMLQSG